MRKIQTALIALCLTLGACGGTQEETAQGSALLSPLNVNGYIWATGQVNDTTAPRYVCNNPSIGAYWHMYVNIAQSYSGFTPPPGVVPQNWTTRVMGDDSYLASDPTMALSTLDCPPAAMAYSATYNVIYNTAPVNCTVRGHVPYGPTKSQAVTIPLYQLQYVPNTTGYGNWVVTYSAPSSYINGTGYCGPATRTFGS